MTNRADTDQISRLLEQHADGDTTALEELMPLVYQQLRRLARSQLARNKRHNTLNTTALVHEAYLKLQRGSVVDWQGRGHFYAICSRTMRRLIVDYARRRDAQKRGGDKAHVTFEPHHASLANEAEAWLAVDRALDVLASFNERLARVVECRFFAGLNEEETAEALGISRRTVQRDWLRARAWLRKELDEGGSTPQKQS